MSELESGQAAATTVKTAEPVTNAVESKPEAKQDASILGGDATQVSADAVTKEGEAKPADVKQDQKTIELKLPEGSLLSEAKLNQIKEFALANNMNQDQAQKLVESENSAVTEYHQTLLKEHEQRTSSWINEVKADQEIGGAKFDENVSIARKMVAEFATPEFKNDLAESGFGSHPGLVKMIVKMGRTIEALKSEDKLVRGNEPPKPQKSIADILYDKTN